MWLAVQPKDSRLGHTSAASAVSLLHLQMRLCLPHTLAGRAGPSAGHCWIQSQVEHRDRLGTPHFGLADGTVVFIIATHRQLGTLENPFRLVPAGMPTGDYHSVPSCSRDACQAEAGGRLCDCFMFELGNPRNVGYRRHCSGGGPPACSLDPKIAHSAEAGVQDGTGQRKVQGKDSLAENASPRFPSITSPVIVSQRQQISSAYP